MNEICLAIIAYNQQSYIRDAIKGALNQDCQPIRIILSDDHSQDETFSIMEDVAKRYIGPHSIELNRNPENLGSTRHLARVAAIAGGGMIVANAGDDISTPQRVTRIYEAWKASGFTSTAIYSQFISMDTNGNALGIGGNKIWSRLSRTPDIRLKQAEGFWSLPGCTTAFSPRVFETFPVLPPGIIADDRIIQLRASLLGPLNFIPEPLLKYRLTPFSQSRAATYGKLRAKLAAAHSRSMALVYETLLADVNRAQTLGLLSGDLYDWLLREIRHRSMIETAEAEMLEAPHLSNRFKIFKRMAAQKGLRESAPWLLYTLVPMSFGLRTYLKLKKTTETRRLSTN